MEAGLWGCPGWSTHPALAATDEIVALARVAARYGGLYASHIAASATVSRRWPRRSDRHEAGLRCRSAQCAKYGAPCGDRTLRLVDEARAAARTSPSTMTCTPTWGRS
jgi:hypothetical protein